MEIIGSLSFRSNITCTFFLNIKNNLIKIISSSKEPQWDVPTELMESIVIRNTRDYYDTINLQKEMLETAKMQKNVNKIRIKEMYKIQQELKERFVKTNAFIKECEDKTQIAKNRIAENKKVQSVLDANINQLKVKNEELADFKKVLADTVNGMIPYETVINEVVAQSDVLTSVSDCMARCDALSRSSNIS